jgi:muconolactone delta-isomerase
MLFMVISTPRPEKPSMVTASRRAYWEWLAPLQKNGLCKGVWARTGRGAIALLDVADNETLHKLMNEWAEIIPATFEVYPVIDPGPAKDYLKKQSK